MKSLFLVIVFGLFASPAFCMDLNMLDTAGSALISERLRMDVISGNLANINTTHDNLGNVSPYKRRSVQFRTIYDEASGTVKGVSVANISEDTGPGKAMFDPSHPDANANGYVYYPDISVEREMVDMVSAKTSYQANIKSIQVMKSMFNASLEI